MRWGHCWGLLGTLGIAGQLHDPFWNADVLLNHYGSVSIII